MSRRMYWLICHCRVTRYICKDDHRNWVDARRNVTVPCAICKMAATSSQMDDGDSMVHIEKSNIWMAPLWCEVRGLVVSIHLFTRIYVPNKFILLSMATARVVKMISREKNTRRIPKTSRDRWYITHIRRIITTVATVRYCWWAAQRLTVGGTKIEKECPSANCIKCLTFDTFMNQLDTKALTFYAYNCFRRYQLYWVYQWRVRWIRTAIGNSSVCTLFHYPNQTQSTFVEPVRKLLPTYAGSVWRTSNFISALDVQRLGSLVIYRELAFSVLISHCL